MPCLYQINFIGSKVLWEWNPPRVDPLPTGKTEVKRSEAIQKVASNRLKIGQQLV